ALPRHFIHGTCRLGQSCHFSHQLPVWKSSQICKYFQKGCCWFGDRCSSAFQNRRGSELSVQQAHGGYAGSRRGSAPAVTSLASLQRNFERLSTEFEEDEENHAASEFRPMRQQAVQQLGQEVLYSPVEVVSLHTLQGIFGPLYQASSSQQEAAQSSSTDSRDMSRGADAAASASDAYERSKDVMCGICMDKVYEKPAPEDRRFGILPNCSHPFCLGCIVTWRKTKDFQDEVIKSCPQCRVKSTFYIPNKYWVSDPAQKHTLVAKFKERTSSTEESDSEGFHIMQYAVALALLHDDDDVLDDHFSHRRFFEIFLDDSYLDSD
ncbi:UNVERIFIED_CONTAM: hypothetical protein FKN15_002332, partial [Acipenser sinensis]